MTRFEQILALRLIVQWLAIIAGAVLGLDTPDHLRSAAVSNMNHVDTFLERLDKEQK